MRVGFMVYEIEHNGDVEASCDDLRQAGCRDIKVRGVDFDAEHMSVECELPAGVNSPSSLNLEFACL